MRFTSVALALSCLFATACGPSVAADLDAGALDGGPPDATPVDAAMQPQDAGPTWLDEPTDELPEQMSELGLFPAAPRLDVVHPSAIRFEPRFPLWSNGAAKERHLALPAGMRIDATDAAGWRFPIGTLLFKTFAFDGTDGPRLIETRVMRRALDGWQYAVYRWDESGTDARLLDLRTETVVDVELEDGAPLAHQIPAALECAQCHESALGPEHDAEVLGLRADMLGESLDALAPFVDGAAEVIDPVAGLAPEHRWVAGYALANCVHCHNGGAGESASFDMRPDVFVASTIGARTTEASSPPGLRVAPGDLEASVLFQMLTRESPDPDIQPMPPVGVQRADAEAIARFEAWIVSLAAE